MSRCTFHASHGNIPVRMTKHSAGYDVYVNRNIVLKPNEKLLIDTHIYAKLDPRNFIAVKNRSSLYQKVLLVFERIIDSDFKDSIIISLWNTSDTAIFIEKNSRFAQLLIQEFFLAEEITVETERFGGFGSSD